MAKGIEINGMLKGKRGGVVYYRANGQQISRARNFSPSNPNTQKQRIQRMIMATCMQAYSFMSEICDHSFENVKYKQDSQSYFLRLNANKLRGLAGSARDQTAYVAKGIQALVPNTYAVSRGSLLSVPFMTGSVELGFPWVLGDQSVALADKLPVSLEVFMQLTNSQPGDMLTFVFINPTGSDLYTQENGEDTRNILRECVFIYHRVKLKSSYTSQQLSFDFYDTDGVIDKTLIVENESNVDGLIFHDPDASLGESNVLPLNCYTDSLAAGVIRSRWDGAKWARSSCDLLVRNTSKYGLSFANALVNWDGTKTNLGNGDWLLNDKLNVNP